MTGLVHTEAASEVNASTSAVLACLSTVCLSPPGPYLHFLGPLPASFCHLSPTVILDHSGKCSSMARAGILDPSRAGCAVFRSARPLIVLGLP